MGARIKEMIFPRNVLVGSGALDQLGTAVKDLDAQPGGIVVVDKTTKELIGDQVQASLDAVGLDPTFYVSKGRTMETVNEVLALGREIDAHYYIGAGGGSVIDVAKLAAYEHGPAFISVPTSASHDGICSGRASIKETTGSVSMDAKPPAAIVADTSIISKAPFRMLSAGCADVISNLTAVKDWELAHRLKAEEYSSFSAVLSKSAADMILEHADLIHSGVEEASWIVVKSLVVSGVSMAVAGSSRPASGAEHMLSHALDRIAPGKSMHGEQVGVGTIIMMELHGGDWKMVRNALQQIGAPTTVAELGIEPEQFLEALTTCHTLRPERYTILGESGLTMDAAKRVCKTTGVL